MKLQSVFIAVDGYAIPASDIVLLSQNSSVHTNVYFRRGTESYNQFGPSKVFQETKAELTTKLNRAVHQNNQTLVEAYKAGLLPTQHNEAKTSPSMKEKLASKRAQKPAKPMPIKSPGF